MRISTNASVVSVATAGIAALVAYYVVKTRRPLHVADRDDYDSDEEASREILEASRSRGPPMLNRLRPTPSSFYVDPSAPSYRGGGGESMMGSLLDVTAATGHSMMPLMTSERHDTAASPAEVSARSLKLAFLTFNINGATLTAADAVSWIKLVGTADAYFVGIQELIDIVDSTITGEQRAAMSHAQATLALDALKVALEAVCGEELDLVSPPAVMVSIFLAVFVRKELVYDELLVEPWLPAHYTKPPKLGNKGGVAVSVRLAGCLPVCALNVHLPAGEIEEAIAARDEAAQTCFHSLAASLTKAESSWRSLAEHGLGVVLGDVNSRTSIDADAAIAAIEHSQQLSTHKPTELAAGADASSAQQPLAALLANDELCSGQSSWAARRFTEASITFAPSYKFKPNSSKYDSKPSKPRTPSWCDRVLWRAASGVKVAPLTYSAAFDVVPSDHKPVAALLRVTLPAAASASAATE